IEKNNGEKYGNIRIFGGKDLKNIDILPGIIPNIIDEIPVLSVIGLFAAGSFKIKGAGELRVKESDRIKALCSNFKILGLNPNEYEDGFELQGAITNKQPEFESFHDHRIAMAFGVLSMLLPNGGTVKNFECVKISNPNFLKQLNLIAR
ncbi:MAG TPA: 3-phosphoshikimate 1-carboxyvinyltransferase, partial [Ignavibacteriales bacterium]|nr:3-phosphoshikimate 1-carboxyvinyltransferase [Ignavibacteriales bacterium]